jgi:hypothetical protein
LAVSIDSAHINHLLIKRLIKCPESQKWTVNLSPVPLKSALQGSQLPNRIPLFICHSHKRQVQASFRQCFYNMKYLL